MTRILVENLNGLDLGGITTHIFNYISVLQRSSDYKIDIVVTVQENNDVIDKFKSLGCGIIHLPHRQKQLFRYIMALCRIMYKGSYDIVHIHGNSATAVLELQIAKWLGIKARIIHNHSSCCQHKILNKLLLPGYRRSFTQAIACSIEAGEWLYGETQFTILRNAIKVEPFIYSM